MAICHATVIREKGLAAVRLACWSGKGNAKRNADIRVYYDQATRGIQAADVIKRINAVPCNIFDEGVGVATQKVFLAIARKSHEVNQERQRARSPFFIRFS